MATENDLSRQVMQQLAIIPSGETPTAEEHADIKECYEQKLLQLVDDDYADWDSGNTIPDQAMPGLVRLIAYEIGPSFGVMRATMIEADSRTWEAKGFALLRRYMRQKPTYEETQANYF